MSVSIPYNVDAAAIRKRFGLTQKQFSELYGLPIASLRNWEQNRTRPDETARAYLTLIERRADVVRETLERQPAMKSAGQQETPGPAKSADLPHRNC